MTLAVPATLSGLYPLTAPAGAAEDSALPNGAAPPPGGFLVELLAWSPAAGWEHETRNSLRPDEPPEGPEPGPVSGLPPAAPPLPEEDGRRRILESAGSALPTLVAPAVAALASLSASVLPEDLPLPLEPALPVSALSPFPGLGASGGPSPASCGAEAPTPRPGALGRSLPEVFPLPGGEAPRAAAPSSGAPVSALGGAWPAAGVIDAATAAAAPPREIPRGALALAIEATQKPPALALEGSRAYLPSKPPEPPARASAVGVQPMADAPPECPAAQPPLPGPASRGETSVRAASAVRVRPQLPHEALAGEGALPGPPSAGADEARHESPPEAVGERARPVRQPEVADAAQGRVPPARAGNAPVAKQVDAHRPPARQAATSERPAGDLPGANPAEIRTAPGPAGLSNRAPGAAAAPESARLVAGEAPLRAAPAAPARRIELRLARPHAEALTVEVAERRGRIELAVRTPDRELAASLGEQASEVVRRLEAAGFRAQAFTPHAPDRALEPRLEMTAEAAPDFERRGGDDPHESGRRNPEQGAGQDSDGEFSEEKFFSLRAGREEIDR